jgi:DNA anti-recombination protein RmuC
MTEHQKEIAELLGEILREFQEANQHLRAIESHT